MMTNNGSITFRTETQACLFENEIAGQISDGHWENAGPRHHYKPWCSATVNVGTDVGRDFWCPRDYYGLSSPSLLSVVGQRMLTYVRLCQAFGRDVTKKYAEVLDLEGNIPTREQLSHSANWESATGAGYWSDKLALYDSLPISSMRAAVAVNSYGMKQLRADLREMSLAMRVAK